VALHLLEGALDLSVFTCLVACTNVFKLVAFVVKAAKHALWTLLVACDILAATHVTGPDCFRRNLLPVAKWKKVVRNMIRHVLDEAPWLLHKLGLGIFVKVGARRMRAATVMAHHDGMKFFASSLLLSPGVGTLVAACLVALIVMATLLVTHHGFTNQLQLLDCRGLGHWTFEVASKVVSTSIVASLGICHGGIEDIALSYNAFEWAFELGASANANFILVAFPTACFDLLPSGLLGQVRVEEIINHLLDRQRCCR
jgi:hypothetical protein